MCRSKADGGRRCAGHMRARLEKAQYDLDRATPGTGTHEAAKRRLAAARAQLLLTHAGIVNYIHDQTGPGRDTAEPPERQAARINDYLATAKHPERGSRLELPGGTVTALRAHPVGKHVVLEVAADNQSCETLHDGLQKCYDDPEAPAGKQVTVCTPEELKTEFMHHFVLLDGRAGGGVKNDGEIAALYSNSPSHGAADALVRQGLAAGGTHLECFDTFLPRIYARNGFVPVARIPFNRDYAPEGWDYSYMSRFAEGGEPDIVFMASEEHYDKMGRPEERTYAEWDDANWRVRNGEGEDNERD